MSVELLAIKFNHNPNSAKDDALNIRKNAKEFVTVPEWRRGMNKPEESLAAYSLRDTQGNKIIIQALFGRTDPTLTTVEVRAVHPPPPPLPSGWLQWLRSVLEKWPWLWNVLVYLFYTGFGKNVLGEVKTRQITFQANDESGFAPFELDGLFLWQRGVGIHTVTWRWQFRLTPTSPWTDFAESHHRIYTVLEEPKLPWQQTPYDSANTQLPWSEVLDYACQWAAWRYTLDDAAAGITRSVYNLGPAVITYDCPNQGYSWYSYPDFDCSAFLERLHGMKGNGYYVNCSDCATFVSTFANILGCDLRQSRMEPPVSAGPWAQFELNPLLGIGSTTWQPACGWTGFNYHEVAWKGNCTANDEVFDACLQVDGDSDPTVNDPAHTPLLPIHLRFGTSGSGEYRDRLATPTGRPKCEPNPGSSQHRMIT